MELVDAIDAMTDRMGHNEMIPSERELAKRYDMSRMTVRKAIDYLVDKNKLYRIKNKGTYTTDEKLYKKMDAFVGFTREVKEAGGVPSTELIEFSLRAAGEDVAKKLHIEPTDKVYKVIRLRKKNDLPLMIDESYFPKDIIPLTEEVVKSSVYDYIQNTLALDIAHAKQKIYATFASETYQHYLDINPYTPVIHLELTGYLKDGRVFEYTNSFKNSERYDLVINSSQ